jgi:type II secretory pathway pseudopilin PulG
MQSHLSSKKYSKLGGFTLIEILGALAIFVILISISLYSLSAYRSSKSVEVTANEIAFKLEEAKGNSIAGKNGQSFGIHFSTSSYVYFEGSSYVEGNIANKTPNFPLDLEIVNGLTGSASDIIFAKITGKPNISGTITVRKTSDTSKTKTITIGALGDVSVVQ